MPKRTIKQDVTEDPRYHDTWRLLKRYRDVVWSMELSVQQMKNQFQIEYGCSIEDFLDSVYLAGADLSGTDLEDHARCIERSNKMLTLVNNSIELLRTRHKHGEDYYWLLYYTYLSPQQLKNVEEIVEQLRPHIRDISLPTYYRKRKQAVEALSSVLWGFTSQECRDTGLHCASGICHGGVPVHLKHLQELVPYVRRPALPAVDERLVPAPVYQHGRRLYRQPTFYLRRAYHETKYQNFYRFCACTSTYHRSLGSRLCDNGGGG